MDSGKGSANSDGKGPLTGRLFVYCVFQRLICTNHGGQIAEAPVDQRVQHSELFQDSDITTVADFMQQDAGQLAAFLRVCHDHCAELEGCASNRD